jgi:hypothetical protein
MINSRKFPDAELADAWRDCSWHPISEALPTTFPSAEDAALERSHLLLTVTDNERKRRETKKQKEEKKESEMQLEA